MEEKKRDLYSILKNNLYDDILFRDGTTNSLSLSLLSSSPEHISITSDKRSVLFLSSFGHEVKSSSLQPHELRHTSSLSLTTSRSLRKLMSIELVTPANHLVLCCPLLLLSIFLSIRVFADESALAVIKKYEKNHILPMFSFPRQ